MPYNYDYTRKDGTEVMVCYRIKGGGGFVFAGGCWHPGDDIEVDFEERVYGLPEGEKLTSEEWDEIEAAILKDPPEYDYGPDDY